MTPGGDLDRELAFVLGFIPSPDAAGRPYFKPPRFWGHLDPDLHGWFYDIDLDGNSVALLGFPTVGHLRDGMCYLWRGDLGSKLGEWSSQGLCDPEHRSDPEASLGYQVRGTRLGGVRFLPNGDLLVAAPFTDGVQRIRAGKVQDHWTLGALRASLALARGKAANTNNHSEGGDPEKEPGPSLHNRPQDLLAYRASLRFRIDEVLVHRKQPAAIVHVKGDQKPWKLVVLGAELAWYDLPLAAVREGQVLRADSDKRGRIAVLPVDHYGARVDDIHLVVVDGP